MSDAAGPMDPADALPSDDDSPSAAHPSQATGLPPRYAGIVGMALILASLTMLFVASLVGYAVVRITSPNAPQWGALYLPWLVWPSTAFMLLSSLAVHGAIVAARRERHKIVQTCLILTTLAAALFLTLQTPAMIELMQNHRQQTSQQDPVYLFGLLFILVLLHALHVVGGLAGLAIVNFKAYRHAYDHEDHRGLTIFSMYWHFLDVVWLVMLAVLLLLQ